VDRTSWWSTLKEDQIAERGWGVLSGGLIFPDFDGVDQRAADAMRRTSIFNDRVGAGVRTSRSRSQTGGALTKSGMARQTNR
jgi:hypothetical protein